MLVLWPIGQQTRYLYCGDLGQLADSSISATVQGFTFGISGLGQLDGSDSCLPLVSTFAFPSFQFSAPPLFMIATPKRGSGVHR
jgi:hypothetical protein